MNVITLHGSPKRDGNSDTLVKHFINGLNTRSIIELKQFILYDMNIKPCQGCRSCNYSENNACIIDDDMQKIYTAFENVDVVVFATPMYWGYMTAQMKLAFDRMEALAMNPEKYWDYLDCRTGQVINRHEETREMDWMTCAQRAGIHMDAIEVCSQSEKGVQYLKEDIFYAKELHIDSNPTFLIRNKWLIKRGDMNMAIRFIFDLKQYKSETNTL